MAGPGRSGAPARLALPTIWPTKDCSALAQLLDKGPQRLEGRPITHNNMAGGRYALLPEEEEPFLEQYAAAVSRGEQWSLSEVHSDVFPFFMDLDYYAEQPECADDELLEILGHVQDALRPYFPRRGPSQLNAVVLRSDPKRACKAGYSGYKCGIHVVYGSLLVDEDRALQLRQSIIHELDARGPPRPEWNPWSDVVDRAVYRRGTGLRMLGSVKVSRCPSCKDNTKEDKKSPSAAERRSLENLVKARRRTIARKLGITVDVRDDPSPEEMRDPDLADLLCKLEDLEQVVCRACSGIGRCVEANRYEVHFAVSEDAHVVPDLTALLREDLLEALRRTSVRCPDPGARVSPEYVRPANAPPYVPNQREDRGRGRGDANPHVEYGKRLEGHRTLAVELRNGDVSSADAEAIAKWPQPREVEDPAARAAVQAFVRKFYPRAYGQILVKNVFRLPPRPAFGAPPAASGAPSGVVRELMRNAQVAASSGPRSAQQQQQQQHIYAARVSGPGSTFCHNKGAAHANNTVWFQLTEDKCVQRCFSRKLVQRNDGACPSYRGQERLMTTELARVLWPSRNPEPAAQAPAAPPKKRPRKDPDAARRTQARVSRLQEAEQWLSSFV